MHVVASEEYLGCEDLVPAACESINVDVSLEELSTANGYGCIALLAYDVEGISGLEFALSGWPTGRGAPALDGPYWCSDGATTFGDHLDGGGGTGLGECAEPDSSGLVLVGYFYFGPVDSSDVPINFNFIPSTYTEPEDSILAVTDCTEDFVVDEVVAHSGCTVGGTYSGPALDCAGRSGDGGSQEPGELPSVSFLGPTIQRAHDDGSVFALTVTALPSDAELHLERDGERKFVTTRWVFDDVLECRAKTNREDTGLWDVVLETSGKCKVRLPRAVRLVESSARTMLEESGVEYRPGIVGAKIRHAALALPEGAVEASPSELAVCSEALQRAFSEFSIRSIEKVFKHKTPADTLACSPSGEVVRVDDLSRFYVLRFPPSVDVGEVLSALEVLPEVLQVWPRFRNEWNSTPRNPDDPWYVLGVQWPLNSTYPGQQGADIDAPEAWGLGIVTGEVTIAINDVGIYYQHEDLADTDEFPNWKVTCGCNLVEPTEPPDDPYDPDWSESGHGTHCAGIAAAVTDNGKGMAGVAWGTVSLASIKVGSRESGLPYSAAGMVSAVDSCHADVISMAYSHFGYEANEGAAARYAITWGTFLTASVSNSDTNSTVYPAACNYVAGVTATEGAGGWMHTNYGPHVDLAAPGQLVLSTSNNPDAEYEHEFGTSVANPHVAGLAALLKGVARQRGITLYPDDILGIMCAAADTVSKSPPYPVYPNDDVGWGKINARKAMERLFWPYNTGGGPALYHAGGYDASYQDSTFTFGDPDTTYYRMCMKKFVHFPACQDTPFAWGHSLWMTNGSIRDPHDEGEMDWSWCRVIPSTVTASSCSLKTYLYYRSVAGKAQGEWVTHEPEDLTWSYGVSGILSGQAVEDPQLAGSRRVTQVSQSYPNPFNPSTSIAFRLAGRGRAKILIYDICGRLVRALVDEEFQGGAHHATWDGLDDNGRPAASGVYFCRLETKDFSETRKLVLVR